MHGPIIGLYGLGARLLVVDFSFMPVGG